MRYYVIRTTRFGIEYKRYKCIEGWSKDKSVCWKFSKQGAENIARRLNSAIKEIDKLRVHYNTLKATV